MNILNKGKPKHKHMNPRRQWRKLLTALTVAISMAVAPAAMAFPESIALPPPTPTTLMTAKCSEPIVFGIVSSTPAAIKMLRFPLWVQFYLRYCTR